MGWRLLRGRPKDGPIFCHPALSRVDLCSAVGTLPNPPDSVTYRGELIVSRRRHSLHPHVTCGRQVPRPKKNDHVVSPRGPVEGMDQLQQPGGSRGRPTAFLSDRRTRHEMYTRRLCPRLYSDDRGLSPRTALAMALQSMNIFLYTECLKVESIEGTGRARLFKGYYFSTYNRYRCPLQHLPERRPNLRRCSVTAAGQTHAADSPSTRRSGQACRLTPGHTAPSLKPEE